MSTLERFFARPSIFCLALLLAGETPVSVTEHVQLRFDDIATAIAPPGTAALTDRNTEMTTPRGRIAALSQDGLSLSAEGTAGSARSGRLAPQPAWVSDSAAAHAADANRRDRTTFRF